MDGIQKYVPEGQNLRVVSTRHGDFRLEPGDSFGVEDRGDYAKISATDPATDKVVSGIARPSVNKVLEFPDERRTGDKYPGVDRARALLGYLMNCVCSNAQDEHSDYNVPVPPAPDKKPRIRKDDTVESLKRLIGNACLVLKEDQKAKEKAEGSRRDPTYIGIAWYEANEILQRHAEEILPVLQQAPRNSVRQRISRLLDAINPW